MDDFGEKSVQQFLDETASRTPAPGGGGVTAASAALSTAMGRMVVAYSVGKKTDPKVRETMEKVATQLERIDHLLRALITQDAIAYVAMTDAAKTSRDNPEMDSAYRNAAFDAVAVPMEIAALTSRALAILDEHKDLANKYLLSDLGVAVVLGEASVRAAEYTVRVNLPELSDSERSQQILKELAVISEHSETHRQSIERFVHEHFERQ